MCVTDPGLVKELLSFKNFLAGQISEYHLNEANTRYDSSGGIEIISGHYLSFHKNRLIPVVASLRDKSILLTSDDVKKEYVANIMLLGIRNTGAYSLKKAVDNKMLKEGWIDNLSTPPPFDCCVVLPGNYYIEALLLRIIIYFLI